MGINDVTEQMLIQKDPKGRFVGEVEISGDSDNPHELLCYSIKDGKSFAAGDYGYLIP